MNNDIFRFITAGSVDDGKSTLIGRLLFDSKNIFNDQIEYISNNKNKNIDFSLITDGLEAEIEQGITIDVAYRYFYTSKRKFIISDAPGHEQYTRNMITGASNVNAIIILIDISKINKKKNIDLLKQTKRHSIIANLLNIKDVIVAINKIDLVNYDKNIYDKIKKIYKNFVKNFNFKNLYFIPLSALYGDNVVNISKNTSWYKGPTLMNILESIDTKIYENKNLIRFPIQLVFKNNKNNSSRGYMGRLISGKINLSKKLILLPSKKEISIKKIYIYKKLLNSAHNGQSITIFINENLEISRGYLMSSYKNQPNISKNLKSNICWLSEKKLNLNKKYLLKCITKITYSKIIKINYIININNNEKYYKNFLELNDIACVNIQTQDNIIFDKYIINTKTGSFILIDKSTNQTVASGMIL